MELGNLALVRTACVLSLCLVAAPFARVGAQLVYIPDPSFRTFLQTDHPEVMVGDSLDPAAPELASITTLDLQMGVLDLTGLEYFASAQNISLYDTVEVWPSAFPAALRQLNLTNMIIEDGVFAVPFNPALSTLEFNGCYFLGAPALPEGPGYIRINGLFALDAQWPGLPASADSLRVDSWYQPLPETLQIPTTLRYLMLQDGAPLATALPPLANSELVELRVFTTTDSVPDLPPTLQELYLWNMTGDCLPTLPESLTILAVSGTGITCVPNIPPFLIDNGDWPVELCTMWNSLCFGGNTISGAVFRDDDQNGLLNGPDVPVMNRSVTISPVGTMTSTNVLGHYTAHVPAGAFEVFAEEGPYDQFLGATPTANFTGVGGSDSGNDIGLLMQTDMVDLAVSIVSEEPRPGFENVVWITCLNNGSTVIEGTLDVTFDALQTLVNTEPIATTVNGQLITWELAPLGLGEQRTVMMYLSTPEDALLGTPVQYTANITPSGTDATPIDNMAALILELVGSFDPNDKTVRPDELSPQEIQAGTAVDYVVRFQNTGTFYAVNVSIIDTLSPDLDRSTFQFIGASHPYEWELQGGVLHVRFPDIYLPDSNTYEPASHGFLRFRIEPFTTTPMGSQIANQAHIYFDFNAPVSTNVALLDMPVAVRADEQGGPVLQPNPVTTTLTIALPGTAGRMDARVVDATGREVHRAVGSAGLMTMDMAHLEQGHYVLRMGLEGRWYVRPFVKW